MTDELFRRDSYLRECDAAVVAVDGQSVTLDRTVFYPLGGGQPGDSGAMTWASGSAKIVDTRYGDSGEILHVLEDGSALPPPGETVLRYGVTGGNISTDKSRLDFDMEDPIDKEAVGAALAALVAEDHPIGCRWISDAELDANPELVRTMSVQPPRGKGEVRLLEIEGVDLQPCGGTHLKSTAEVGTVRIGKVEKKGRRNRRVNIHLDD
jgi:misacylated tRNA(Ala) deacylase